MPDFDVRAAVEVGDGAGHLQDAVVSTGGSNIIVQTVHIVRGQDNETASKKQKFYASK